MHFSLNYLSKCEIGVYMRITNTYVLVGRTKEENTMNFFRENVNCPIIETTINHTKNVGAQCIGNSKALIVPETCNDQELNHIRSIMPAEIKVVRMREKWNCLGNIMVCNDHVGLIHPGVEDDTISALENILEIPVYRKAIGNEELVGTYSVANNCGLLTHPGLSEKEIRDLGDMTNMRVIAGTINNGYGDVGSGVVVNDWLQLSGMKSTPVEIAVLETVFNFKDNSNMEDIIADEII